MKNDEEKSRNFTYLFLGSLLGFGLALLVKKYTGINISSSVSYSPLDTGEALYNRGRERVNNAINDLYDYIGN